MVEVSSKPARSEKALQTKTNDVFKINPICFPLFSWTLTFCFVPGFMFPFFWATRAPALLHGISVAIFVNTFASLQEKTCWKICPLVSVSRLHISHYDSDSKTHFNIIIMDLGISK